MDTPLSVSRSTLQRVWDLLPRPTPWLWPFHLGANNLALLEGDPGLGKSLLALDLCARVSRGLPFPDDPATARAPRRPRRLGETPQRRVECPRCPSTPGDVPMPLLDHFHPPLSQTRKWEGFHSQWAGSLAAQLNAGLLPPRHFAEPQVSHGRIEVDVAADRLGGHGAASGLVSASSGAVATLAAPVWSPPAPTLEMDAVFTAEFTVLVINVEAGPTLVGAIELVSPSNKARPAARRAFAMKCLNYLNAGIGLIIVDVVTERLANLHDQMAELIAGNAPRFPGTPSIYAAAYRPFRRNDDAKVSTWPATLTVGEPLPVLPLWLREVEGPVRVDLEAAYTEARQRSALA